MWKYFPKCFRRIYRGNLFLVCELSPRDANCNLERAAGDCSKFQNIQMCQGSKSSNVPSFTMFKCSKFQNVQMFQVSKYSIVPTFKIFKCSKFQKVQMFQVSKYSNVPRLKMFKCSKFKNLQMFQILKCFNVLFQGRMLLRRTEGISEWGRVVEQAVAACRGR